MNYKNNLELSIYLRSFGIFDTNIISAIEEIPIEFFKTENINNNISLKQKFKNKFDKQFNDAYLAAIIAQKLQIGIINTFSKIIFQEKLIIYPNPIKPPQSLLDKILTLNTEGFDYEFDKIEEDKFSQNLSKISWKHYSIRGKLFYKKFIFKNNNENLIIDIENLSNDKEKALSYAAYLINQMYDQKRLFSIKYKDYLSDMSCSYYHKKKQLIYLANV